MFDIEQMVSEAKVARKKTRERDEQMAASVRAIGEIIDDQLSPLFDICKYEVRVCESQVDIIFNQKAVNGARKKATIWLQAASKGFLYSLVLDQLPAGGLRRAGKLFETAGGTVDDCLEQLKPAIRHVIDCAIEG